MSVCIIYIVKLVYTYIYMCIHVCVCVCVYITLYIGLCIYIYIYTPNLYIYRQPTPVFLSGKSHRQRSLAGYISWGRKESDMI